MSDWKNLYRTRGVVDSYTKQVIDHFEHPRNVGRIADDDGLGKAGDPSCGDHVEFTIKVDNDRICDVRFLVYGCPAAIATSSVTTELAMGRTTNEAARITEQEVLEALGGLPQVKIHCSLMSVQALRAALADYHHCRRLLADGEIADVAQYREQRNADQVEWIATETEKS